MTVVQESGSGIQRFRGFRRDEKPRSGVFFEGELVANIKVGSVFTEIDTGERFFWDGNIWRRQEQTIETLLGDLIEVQLDILAATKVIQAAAASMANNQCDTEYPIE